MMGDLFGMKVALGSRALRPERGPTEAGRTPGEEDHTSQALARAPKVGRDRRKSVGPAMEVVRLGEGWGVGGE
jgi:hypothetical protein